MASWVFFQSAFALLVALFVDVGNPKVRRFLAMLAVMFFLIGLLLVIADIFLNYRRMKKENLKKENDQGVLPR